MPWAGAHARVELGRALAAAGDADSAERLYRNALEWSGRPRPHRTRESMEVRPSEKVALQLLIAGTPAAAALHGLAELADARGDAAAAAELRSRAKLAAT